MNRTLTFGIVVFAAILGIALLGNNEAEARLFGGCGGCGGGHCGGAPDCCGVVAPSCGGCGGCGGEVIYEEAAPAPEAEPVVPAPPAEEASLQYRRVRFR